MLRLQIDEALSSGLWPELAGPITEITVADPPFASGAYGAIHKGLTLNGQPPPRPLAVKLLFEGSGNEASIGVTTIRRLQEQIREYQRTAVNLNRPPLTSLPLLRALPQLSFTGRRSTGEVVRGYVAELLPLPPFGELIDLFDWPDLAERGARRQAFYGLPQTARIQLGVDLVQGFQALAHLNFIHADLNAHNLLVSAQPAGVCLLDYDSGAVTVGTTDEPQTFGKPGEWLAPEVMAQLMGPGTARVKVNVDTDAWAVMVGLHFLLFPFHPLYFLRTMGLNDVREYLKQFQWPEIDPASPLFHPGRQAHYATYREHLSRLPPGLVRLFSATISRGAFNTNQRASYGRWLTEFQQLLRVEPVIAAFDCDTPLVPDLAPVRLSWRAEGAAALTLSGVGNVLGETEAWVSVSQDTTFLLEATGFGGQKVVKKLLVRTDPAPPVISFSGTPAALLAGEEVKLSWTVTGAASITLGEALAGDKPVKAKGNAARRPSQSTRYVLRATSVFGVPASATQEIKVYPLPAIPVFEAAHGKIRPGQPTELRWQAEHCQELTLDEGGRPRAIKGTANSLKIQPTRTTVYVLEALALDGKTRIRRECTVEVIPPVALGELRASRLFTLPTVAVELRWPATDAHQLVLLPDGIDVKGKTRIEVRPNRSTTYELEARNELGDVKRTSVRIEVQPLPRLDGLKLPEPPRLLLSTPPILGAWQPHDPTQTRRQLFEAEVLPPPPGGGTSSWPVSDLYARLRTALGRLTDHLRTTPPNASK